MNKAVVIILVLIVIGFVAGSFYAHNTCKISINESIGYKNYNEENKSKVINNVTIGFLGDKWIWIKKNIFLCEEEKSNIIEEGWGLFKGALGFNETFYTFIPYLLVGGLAGLWLWLMYLLARTEQFLLLVPVIGKLYEGYGKSLKASWLGFIGNSPWKIIPIAVLYATLMQIPIVNSFIKVVTFEVLLGLTNSSIWSAIVRSFIIAFYIGLLPTVIEEYTRYRIRKKYYTQLQRIKFEKRAIQELGAG